MSDTTLRELIYGKGAHVDPVACVEDISADVALYSAPGCPHSIWRIVLHMSYWMDYEFVKIAGENPSYPANAIESWPEHPSPSDEAQWQRSRAHFVEDLKRLATLAESDSAVLDRLVTDSDATKTPRQSTVRTALCQIAAHNSYHVGQIAMLRRQAGAWPPERGGDTW
jgi:uncharacterized damage-inducible protein DinB